MSEFNVGKDAMGFIYSAQFIATVFGAILFGELADRFGRKRALIYSIIWDGILTALSSLAPDYHIFALLRILSGMGVSWGIGFALLSEVYSPKHRGLFGGLIHAMFVLGYVISAASVSILYPLFGWRPIYLIGLYPIPIILFLAYFMPESRIWLQYRELEKLGEVRRGELRFKELFRGKILKLTIFGSILFWASEFAYHASVDWAPTFISEFFGYSVEEASSIVLTISLAVVAFIPFVGFISDYIGRRLSFTFSASIGLIGTILLGYYSLIETNLDLAFISLYILPLGFGAHALYGVWSSEMFPTKVRATGTSFVFSVARGLSIGGFLVGYLSMQYGLPLSMVSLTLIGFILMITLCWTLPETKGKLIKVIE
jgi:MFS family permease